MKYRSYHLLLAGIFSLLTTGAMAEKTSDKPYWQDVQVVSVNKEYPRTSFMTYDNRTDALTGKFEKSNYYQLLNGTWKFFCRQLQRPSRQYHRPFREHGLLE